MKNAKELERKKERIRNDPATKRLAAKLGVTVDKLLEGFGEPKTLVDTQSHRPDAERYAEIEAALRRGYARAQEQQEIRGQKRDGFTAEEQRRRENQKKTLVGQEIW
jgi:hypothetical protein